MISCPMALWLTRFLLSYLPSIGVWFRYDLFDCPKSQLSSYVDNRASTPYGPRETVVHGEGERYATSTAHPSAPRILAAEPVARLQCPEPRLGGRLSGPPTCPPRCPRHAGSHDSRAQKFRGAHARSTPVHSLLRPDADDSHGY